MSFSPNWDAMYKNNQHMSIWPWSDMISYVMRYSKPGSETFKVLELGCGAGANISFFEHLEVDYYAIEGSEFSVNVLLNKYPKLINKIKVGDFTKEIPFETKFDLIIDRASITHNNTVAISNCISLISDKLKDGGVFIGIDWFSTSHSEFTNGVFSKDENTKTNYADGQFQGLGQVHFSDKFHIIELFKNFEFIKLEHKIVTQEFPETDYQFASWNFAVKKC